MKPPIRILLYQPHPDTSDFEWCDTKDQLNVDNINSHMYVRADFVLEVLEEHKKVTELIDELGNSEPSPLEFSKTVDKHFFDLS